MVILKAAFSSGSEITFAYSFLTLQLREACKTRRSFVPIPNPGSWQYFNPRNLKTAFRLLCWSTVILWSKHGGSGYL